jgi:hypothetical protein
VVSAPGPGPRPGAASRDWFAWHDAYDDPAHSLPGRLVAVQARINQALLGFPPGPIRVLSMCAGQGRDLLGVLADHPRRDDVGGVLVELDPRNVEAARATVRLDGLTGIDVVEGDAGTTDAYAGAVPADLLLVCGVFGNVTEPDIEGTIAALPSLAAPGAHVLWTRHRLEPDRTPWIRERFVAGGFEEVGFDSDGAFGLGHAVLTSDPRPFAPGLRLFTFSDEAVGGWEAPPDRP